ncbi:hypothetical protein CsSME_00006013 [Camellia sinensis var. sinensis]
MGKSRNWFGIVRKKLFGSLSPQETIIVFHTNNTSTSLFTEETRTPRAVADNNEDTKSEVGNDVALSKEDIAATKVQAFFRGHLWSGEVAEVVEERVVVVEAVMTRECSGIGKKGISGIEEPGEATSSGTRGVREKTGSYSLTLHACTCSLADHSPCTPTPHWIKLIILGS